MPEIRTVTGPIEPQELGFTLMHEHILCDASVYRPLLEPQLSEEYRAWWDKPLTMDKLALLRKMPVMLRESGCCPSGPSRRTAVDHQRPLSQPAASCLVFRNRWEPHLTAQ